MKISKAPGLGRFGAIVDDFDYDSIEAWQELKELNLKSLVTLVRGNNTDVFNKVVKNIPIVGRARRTREAILEKQYGEDFYLNPDKWNEYDRQALAANKRWSTSFSELPNNWGAVSGKLDDTGKAMGVFAGSRCLWHSNESGCYYFSPLVVLYGHQGMVGSSTGFCSSADWYEKQSESFRSELDELVAFHDYKPYAIGPDADEQHEAAMRRNFTQFGGAEIPLVIKSPGGIKGLHFTEGTITHFVGMSKKDSDALMAKLLKELYVEEYMWNSWWPNDRGDLMLFDNTIVAHNRTIRPNLDMVKFIENRIAYRHPCDYRGMNDYEPFFQEKYNELRRNFTDRIFFNSDMFDKHQTKKIIESLSEEERAEYVKRFTEQELATILATDIFTEAPHLSKFVK
jgi:hypothetical protein